MTCSTAGCGCTVQARGLCTKHGANGFCSAVGCNDGAKARGVCCKHSAKPVCSWERCTTAVYSRGRCHKHGVNNSSSSNSNSNTTRTKQPQQQPQQQAGGGLNTSDLNTTDLLLLFWPGAQKTDADGYKLERKIPSWASLSIKELEAMERT